MLMLHHVVTVHAHACDYAVQCEHDYIINIVLCKLG